MEKDQPERKQVAKEGSSIMVKIHTSDISWLPIFDVHKISGEGPKKTEEISQIQMFNQNFKKKSHEQTYYISYKGICRGFH